LRQKERHQRTGLAEALESRSAKEKAGTIPSGAGGSEYNRTVHAVEAGPARQRRSAANMGTLKARIPRSHSGYHSFQLSAERKGPLHLLQQPFQANIDS